MTGPAFRLERSTAKGKLRVVIDQQRRLCKRPGDLKRPPAQHNSAKQMAAEKAEIVVWVIQGDVEAEIRGSSALTGCNSQAALWRALNTMQEERSIFVGGRTEHLFFLELSILAWKNLIWRNAFAFP